MESDSFTFVKFSVFGSALNRIDSDIIDFDRIDFERKIDLCLDTIM